MFLPLQAHLALGGQGHVVVKEEPYEAVGQIGALDKVGPVFLPVIWLSEFFKALRVQRIVPTED